VAVVAGSLAACQPAELDDGWSIWQVVVDNPELEVDAAAGVSLSADAGSLVYSVASTVAVVPFVVLDQGHREVQVHELAPFQDHRPGQVSPALDRVRMSGDGLHVVGHVTTSQVSSESLEECGGQYYLIVEYQVWRWSRSTRDEEFGDPKLVSEDVDQTLACEPELGQPSDEYPGIYGLGSSVGPSISANGQSVAFRTNATNLGADGELSLAVRDGEGAVELVTPASWTEPVDEAQISANGLHVVFVTEQSGVVSGTVGSGPQVYVASRASVGAPWAFELVSRDGSGSAPSATANQGVSISSDGNRIAW
jgi:hypothetical protein